MHDVVLSDNPALARMAGEFLRKHRHGVDTSEAYDDLRQLLAVAVRDAKHAAEMAEACGLLRVTTKRLDQYTLGCACPGMLCIEACAECNATQAISNEAHALLRKVTP